MFCAQVVLLLVLLFLSVITIIVINIENGFELEKEFNDYMFRFNKTYQRNSQEYFNRFNHFKQSLNVIKELNLHRVHPNSAEFGLNQFSDLSPQEFKLKILRKHKLKLADSNVEKTIAFDLNKNIYFSNGTIDAEVVNIYEDHHRQRRHLDGLPAKVDWREKGVISSVLGQGKCGSCWAFSVIETIESMVAISRNKSTVERLSVQQMIDCAGNNNSGCAGGDTCNLLEWLRMEQTPIETMAEYPMSKNLNEMCHMKTIQKDIAPSPIRVKDFTCISLIQREQDILRYLTENGPLVAGVNAQLWQYYLGGIIQYHCSSDFKDLNHAVQIVGYDRNGDIPYYIVRNSWGTNFGDNGYVKIEIGSNVCGVANQISAIDVHT